MKEETIRELMSFGLDRSVAEHVYKKYYDSDLDSIISFLNNYGEFLKIN